MKSILWFAAGAAVGALVASILVKDRYETKEEEIVESVKRAYGFYDQNEEDPKKDEVEPIVSNEEASMYRKINKASGYDYNNLFRSEIDKEEDSDIAEAESPKEIDAGGPYVINVEQYEADQIENESGYDKITLTYYEEDDTLVDDSSGDVINIEDTIGSDALTRFGEEERDTVYVRNDRLGADYEVIRERASYSRDVLGFEDS